jgi:hypothetical protein
MTNQRTTWAETALAPASNTYGEPTSPGSPSAIGDGPAVRCHTEQDWRLRYARFAVVSTVLFLTLQGYSGTYALGPQAATIGLQQAPMGHAVSAGGLLSRTGFLTSSRSRGDDTGPRSFSGTESFRAHPVWENVTGNATPTDRFFPALSDDPANSGALLFGGAYSQSNPIVYNDTWIYSAGTWVKSTSGSAPPAQAGASMVWDPALRAVLWVGDNGCNQRPPCFTETWSYSNDSWTRLYPTHEPPARWGEAIAYFPLSPAVVIFGGFNDSPAGPALNDTWEYSNGDWLRLTVNSPPPHALGSMAYDPPERTLVLFGGDSSADTWDFNASGWTQIYPVRSPAARNPGAFAYDPMVGSIVLFGGYGRNAPYDLNDTWLFSNGSWTQVNNSPTPEWRTYSGSAFDTRDWALLLVGGFNDVGQNVPDAWAWEAPNVTALASSSATDVGQLVNFTVEAFSPVGGLRLTSQWTSPQLGCTAPTPGGWNFSCVPSANGTWQVTLNVTDADGAWLNETQPFLVYSDPVVRGIDPSQSLLEVGGGVLLTANVTGGTGTYIGSTWSGLPAGTCLLLTNLSEGCSLNKSGFYNVSVSVEDSDHFVAASPGPLELDVRPGPASGPVLANRTSVDVGQSLQLQASPSGGSGVYLRYNWSGLSLGACSNTSGPVVVCRAERAGVYPVDYTVEDNTGANSAPSSPTDIVVMPALDAWEVRVSPAMVDVNETIELNSSVLGGEAPLTLEWQGLPGGCPSVNSTGFSCAVGTAGSFQVSVMVTDANGGQSRTPPAQLTVNPRPRIDWFTASPSSLLVGSLTSFDTGVSGGTPPYSYAYDHLPGGCSSANSSSISCGPTTAGAFAVVVTVTDATGATVRSSLNLTVSSPVLRSSASGNTWNMTLELIGSAVLVGATVTFFVRWRRQRLRDQPEGYAGTTDPRGP